METLRHPARYSREQVSDMCLMAYLVNLLRAHLTGGEPGKFVYCLAPEN